MDIRICAQLRATSLCDEATIAKWWNDRGSVRRATDERLSQAAIGLGITHPSDKRDGSIRRSVSR
jgi:hypothetical protein